MNCKNIIIYYSKLFCYNNIINYLGIFALVDSFHHCAAAVDVVSVVVRVGAEVDDTGDAGKRFLAGTFPDPTTVRLKSEVKDYFKWIL
jgi:hypothetical protein